MLASNSIPPTATYNQTAESQNSKQFCIDNSDSRQYSYQSPISSFTDTSIVTFMETDTENVNGNCDKRCPIVEDRLFHTYDYSRELQNCDKEFEFRSVTRMTTTTIANTNHGTLYLNEFDRTTKEETISELVRATGSGQLIIQQNRLRIALGIILRLVLPLANGVARSLRGIRGLRFLRILKSLTSSRQVLTNILVYAGNTISMSLSSVHVTYRIQEPLLKMVKICKNRNGMDSIPDSPVGESVPLSLLFREPPRGSMSGFTAIRAPNDAPKSVTINVIAEPPPGTPIRADVVIIHGLHGSLNNTWKQGLWNNDRHPVNFKRPPKPPVRPPKRARHSRSNIFSPPHKEKRARFVDQEYFDDAQNSDTLFSYDCVDPEEIIVCDGVECSIPIFRLRIEDRGRLLEDEKILSSEKTQPNDEKISSPNELNYSYCWPADWIPMDCPGVRVIAVNYTTDPYLWRPLWKKKEPRTNLVERSREMSELLIEHQVGYGHPIVWVGHSKGGLFIKQIIVDAWESGRRTAAPLWRSSRGTFFYSVPHRGAHLASIKAPLLCRSVELLDVEKNSKYLLDLHRRFVGLYQMGHLNIEVFSFVETALTLMSVLYLRIVGVDSADPGIGDVCGIQLDHREICKPRNRDCILYKELVKMIKKVC